MALLIIIFIIIPLVHNSVSWLPYHTGKRQWVGNSLSQSLSDDDYGGQGQRWCPLRSLINLLPHRVGDMQKENGYNL